MAGTWKFHHLKREEQTIYQKSGPFSWMCFKVTLYFLPWDSSLIFHHPLGRIFWLEQNLLVGCLFPNIKQANPSFGASHDVSSHGTHIFRGGSIYNFTPSNSCPGGGLLLGCSFSEPPQKKVIIIPNKHPLCKVYIQHMGLIMMEKRPKKN